MDDGVKMRSSCRSLVREGVAAVKKDEGELAGELLDDGLKSGSPHVPISEEEDGEGVSLVSMAVAGVEDHNDVFRRGLQF